jgi:hypothetical protein
LKGVRRFLTQNQQGGKQMEKSPYSRCSRCGGNMVHESFFGPNEQFTGLKCVICGEVIDPVILQNRELMRTGHLMSFLKERGVGPEYIHV